MKKLFPLLASVCFAALALSSCEEIDQFLPTDEVKLAMSETSITLTTGQEYNISVTATSGKISASDVVWNLRESGILSLSADGTKCRITALAEGADVVTARVAGKSASCSVTVKKAEDPDPGPDNPSDSTAVVHVWYVVGDFNDWDPQAGIEMQPSGDNSYYSATFTITGEADEFKFLQDKSWDVNYGAGGDIFMQQGEVYGLSFGGYNIKTSVVGTITVYFNPSAEQMYYLANSITGDNPNMQPESWFLVGTFNDWDVNTGIEMAGPDEEGNYTATLEVGTEGAKFKVLADRSWAVNYGIGPDGTVSEVEVDHVYEAVSYGGDIVIPAPGTYVITFNYSHLTFLFTKVGGDDSGSSDGTEGFGRGDEYDMN